MRPFIHLMLAVLAGTALAAANEPLFIHEQSPGFVNEQDAEPSIDVQIEDEPEGGAELPFIVWPMPNPGPVPLPQPPIPQPKPEPAPVPAPTHQPEAPEATAADLASPGPGFVVNTADDDRLDALEDRIDSLEGRHVKLESRVTKVEEQLKAILTLRDREGKEVKQEVPISQETGYGDHVVPGSYRVVAIDGVPVEQLQRVVVNNTPVYSSPAYSMQTTSQPRTVRVTRRGLFGWRTSSQPASTCSVDPVTGVRTCR